MDLHMEYYRSVFTTFESKVALLNYILHILIKDSRCYFLFKWVPIQFCTVISKSGKSLFLRIVAESAGSDEVGCLSSPVGLGGKILRYENT